MSVALAWTIFSYAGFIVAIIGSRIALREYRDTRDEYLVTRGTTTRIIARDQLRQRKATFWRLCIFALVMTTYIAIGHVALSLPPSPSQQSATIRTITASTLIVGEALLVFAKGIDLYTLYQQRVTRRIWRKAYEMDRHSGGPLEEENE